MIAMAAMSLGMHVFVEKPMAHTIAEGRKMAQLAREKKVATQMGNQGHAADGRRDERLEVPFVGAGLELHQPLVDPFVAAADEDQVG